VRTTVLCHAVTAAVSIMTLALSTGCTAGGGAGSPDDGPKVSAEPSPAVTAAGGLTRLALSGKDIAGHTVKVPFAKDLVVQKDVTAEPAACAPMAYALAGTVVGESTDTVARQVVGKKTATVVTLAAYEGDGAQAAITALSESADACAGGFTLGLDGEEQRVTKVVRELAPDGTDQAMAFGVTTKQGGGKKAPMKVVVFRKDSIVGYFSALNTASPSSGKDSDFPTEVVEAQLLRLA
jgi:hypothetical protein